ncbi:MAG: hypothetical protein NVS3B19_02180 [Ginsengibacter sp.]
MPGRPWGFAPQVAMCIFGGAVVKDKRLAFLLPILSMFLSDALYEILYVSGVGTIPGFYGGQITNYILFGSMTVFGFIVTKINFQRVALAALAAPISYFILSNFVVWIGGGGLHRPRTFAGLMMCYNDAIPFFGWSIAASLFFSAIFFGGYVLLAKQSESRSTQLA